MVTLAEVRIRGTALTPLEPFVRAHFGDEGWETLLDGLEPSDAQIYREGPLAMSWYPFSAGYAITPVLIEMAGGDHDILREVAYAGLDYGTRHIFKAIFKLGSPGFMVARSDLVWRRYYDTGSMTAKVEAAHAHVEVHDFPPMPPHYDEVLLRSVEAVIVKAGGELISSEIVPTHTARCAFEYRWR